LQSLAGQPFIRSGQESSRTKHSHRVRTFVAFVVSLAWCAAAQAQPAVNPRTVTFVASPDHDATTSTGDPVVWGYEMQVYEQGEWQPFLGVDLGKPSPGPDGLISVDFVERISTPARPGRLLEARVVAVGPGGSSPSEPSNLFVFTDWPPQVFLRAPADGTSFNAPASIAISAVFGATESSSGATPSRQSTETAAPPVSEVSFYANGWVIGTASTAPFHLLWQNVPSGRYVITAVARNAWGAQTTSSAVTITVK
jgi:Bacterial Ig domain